MSRINKSIGNKSFVDVANIKFSDTIKNLYILMKSRIYLIIFASIISIITSFVSLQGPSIIGQMTDILVKGISFSNGKLIFNIDYYSLNKKFIFIILIYLGIVILTFVQGLFISYVNINVTYDIREKINTKINKLSIQELDKRLDGDTISLFTNDVNTLTQSLYQLLNSVLPSIIIIIGSILIMLSISVKLTLIVFVFVPLTFIVIGIIVSNSQKYFKELQEKLAKLNSHIEEMYSNHDVILAFNGQDLSIEKFEEINNSLFKASFLSQFLSGLIFPIVSVFNNISYSLVAFFGSTLLFKNILTIGVFQSFIQYLNGFHRPISMISQISIFIQQLKASSDRIFKFLSLPEMEDESSIKPINIENIKGNVEFKNVNFSYNKKDMIINNISFNINPGEKIAIVGHTGSGKTTIINLLMKFYNIDSGDILIDGKSIKEISREDISRIFTMVLQDTWLFEGTIYENISFGENISYEKIKNASKNANSHHFIKTLPNSYNMILNEEISNISIGQKQQLTIARAFLKESKILILDEATSSIDSRTEKLIQEAMKKLMENKTTFIIAHRLSTIKDCDKIMYLENGKIIEFGSHNELIVKKGYYYDLYNSQF